MQIDLEFFDTFDLTLSVLLIRLFLLFIVPEVDEF